MYIKVRVKTGETREKVEIHGATHFVVSVKERNEGNMANARIIEIFKDRYKTKHVRIISGTHTTSKLLSVGM